MTAPYTPTWACRDCTWSTAEKYAANAVTAHSEHFGHYVEPVEKAKVGA